MKIGRPVMWSRRVQGCRARYVPLPPATSVAATIITSHVRIKLSRPAARLAADLRSDIGHLVDGHAILHVGPGQGERERDTLTAHDEVAFRAKTAPFGRVRLGRGGSFFSVIEELSSTAQHPVDAVGVLLAAGQFPVQPLPDIRFQTAAQPSPADYPRTAPISTGSISLGMPLRSTNRMPVSGARTEIGGRPPYGRGAEVAEV